ncbi:Hemerythrin HHE cation binding domain-containing protein [Amycolatopsis arida]|uniref:Hemerythrin HHE cation binding domain-containing protein n=1 Tax=Amycolatopsis arida TaxID=587909 RepID=A0A1I5KRW5_9PSEU|nr:hemerythrin domain-containing protein [Amycolatopsis arida]TDX83557.1 hemerythrin HHE cation binding domain-containing protein [Amycolatopsis arida]SFO87672.1 Hemerythrin HHE cation binding domain-containing protein [Amycolatopsis arida]
MSHDAENEDVIALLRRQHEEIRDLFGEVERARGDERRDAFRRLVRLLSVHETAEEELIHPEVRRVDGGEPVAEARVKEEHRAKELLSTLDELGPDAEGFDTLLFQLRDDVLAHAEHEERAEFPLLAASHDAERLRAMAATVRVAEAVAPTRPHPGVESPAGNVLLGPPLAIMDRVRDAIRSALNR